MADAASVLTGFAARFGRPAAIVARAPGRVNLIGEHTDYNDGFVLPIATMQSTFVASALRDDDEAAVFSQNLRAGQRWPLASAELGTLPLWCRYVFGVAALLRKRGARLRGFEMLIDSDVPVGGGLSSSAALEVAAALALANLAGEPLTSPELADLCRAAEHEFAGVPCGIMDQYASIHGKLDHAMLIDCRFRTIEHVPLPLRGHAFVVVDSGVRHELAAGEYQRRQEDCRRATDYFRAIHPSVRALRDVAVDQVRQHAMQMEPVSAARALHVTAENARVTAAADALRRGELAAFGRLMNESHRSLRDDYEASSSELDQLVEIVGSVPGVLGARMTGGGFGGCIVALATSGAAPGIEAAIRTKYAAPGAEPARVMTVSAGAGARILPV